MARTALILAGALAALSLQSEASAQSWGVGVGVELGGPAYGPPPGYLYGAPPVVYVPPPPPVLYAPAPPVYYQPPPAVVHSSVSPDQIFNFLEDAGYSNFGPMAFRDGVYQLRAINPNGELVALEVSALDGAVENEFPLGAQAVAPRVPHAVAAPAAAPPPGRQPAPPPAGHDPLVVY